MVTSIFRKYFHKIVDISELRDQIWVKVVQNQDKGNILRSWKGEVQENSTARERTLYRSERMVLSLENWSLDRSFSIKFWIRASVGVRSWAFVYVKLKQPRLRKSKLASNISCLQQWCAWSIILAKACLCSEQMHFWRPCRGLMHSDECIRPQGRGKKLKLVI